MSTVGKIESEWQKKHRDVYKKGINSRFWPEILDIIKWLESKEEYEKCDELWKYYQENKMEKPLN
jgi:hypothetical protein